MNRIGLTCALAIGGLVGVIFGIFPKLDLYLAEFFFEPKTKVFALYGWDWMPNLRDAARSIIALLATPPILAIVGKLLLPYRRMLVTGRATCFLLVTLALGPGILANGILKEYWGRARPIDVTEFGGQDRFTPWWDLRGSCPMNCSFVAGEPSGAFWALAPAALTPPQWRPLAVGAALAFGIGVGLLRMAVGAHFFTDVVFGAMLMFFVTWTVHGLIYRWRSTRITDRVIESPLALAGEALRNAFAVLARIAWGVYKRS